MLRQLVDVFIILAFDNKLKSRSSDDLTATAQCCECVASEFKGAISNLDLNEDRCVQYST